MKASVLLTILTSVSASLCCILPFLGLIAGSGSLISTVAWLGPFRPFFIGATLLMLGFAWYSSIRASKKDDCGCDPGTYSFLQSKKVLSVITVVSLLLISFPFFARVMFHVNDNPVLSAGEEHNRKITLAISGMTCSSCERHIESEVIKLSGVASVKGSYEAKSATVEFNPEKVDEEKITEAINSAGYKVQGKVKLIQGTSTLK